MSWAFCTATGCLYHDGKLTGLGYSGHGEGRNRPEFQAVPDEGPIPEGRWLVEGPPTDSPTHGPFVLRLSPCPGTETFGRGGFLLHGDSAQHPGEASKGCIILPRPTREAVWQSGDRVLLVTTKPGVPT